MTAQAFPIPCFPPLSLGPQSDTSDVLAVLSALAADIERNDVERNNLFARRTDLLRQARAAGVTFPVLADACRITKQAVRYAAREAVRAPRMRREQARYANARRAAATRKAG